MEKKIASKQPQISQYLLSTCLHIVDELNDTYKDLNREELKSISDQKFNEMDITVKLGYPFRQTVHYTTGDKQDKGLPKSNHDLYVESKDFKIEVKFLQNYKSHSGNYTSSKSWKEYQTDFDWLFQEIDSNKKHKRAFVIGWFNCVDHFSRIMQLGTGPGNKPLVDERKLCHFPFLKRMNTPTHATDLAYDYSNAYREQPLNLVGKSGDYNCIFLGNETDVFHFALYY